MMSLQVKVERGQDTNTTRTPFTRNTRQPDFPNFYPCARILDGRKKIRLRIPTASSHRLRIRSRSSAQISWHSFGSSTRPTSPLTSRRMLGNIGMLHSTFNQASFDEMDRHLIRQQSLQCFERHFLFLFPTRKGLRCGSVLLMGLQSNLLARVQVNPRPVHHNALAQVLAYLNTHKSEGPIYWKNMYLSH